MKVRSLLKTSFLIPVLIVYLISVAYVTSHLSLAAINSNYCLYRPERKSRMLES